MNWETAPVEGGEAQSGLSAKAIRDQLETLLSSDGFSKSPRMSDFLRFVVSETLAGRADRLKEYAIAVEVFERDASFDPKTNAVVRVEASRLRHRLREYFLGPGRDDPIHIELPPGSYVPEFGMAAGRGEAGFGESGETDAALARPNGPSIAVLPFDNMSGDPDQEFFVDGITEEIITALTQFQELFVVARNSTFQYRGQFADVRKVGGELGVQYVLEGSVRRAADTIRLTAQLTDAGTGAHLWAESYQRKLSPENIFAVQDEITQQIVAKLDVRLERARLDRARRKPPEEMEAYDLMLRARRYYWTQSKDGHAVARDMLERAVRLDPDFSRAHAELVWLYIDEYRFDYNARSGALDRALQSALKAVDLAPDDAIARMRLGKAHFYRNDVPNFLVEAENALTMNPNDTEILAEVAMHLVYSGALDRSYELIRKAMRLDPRHPPWYFFPAALYHYLNHRDDRALNELERARMFDFPYFHAWRAIFLGRLGRLSEARAAADAALAMKPDMDVESHYASYNMPRENLAQFMEGARVAGLA